MNPEDLLQSFITVAIVAIALGYLGYAANKKITLNTEGKHTFRINRFYQILGFILIAIGIFVTILDLFGMMGDDGVGLLITLWVFIGLLALYPMLWYYNHWVTLDEEGLTVSNWKGKAETYEWSTIQEAKFKGTSGYYVVSGEDFNANLHPHIMGFSTLLGEIEKKTGAAVKRPGSSL